MLNEKEINMFGMFSEAGNEAVAKIVKDSLNLLQIGYSNRSAWNWAQCELAILSETYDFEEAMDTEVMESVYKVVTEGMK